jgi:transposase-like protein
MEEQGNEDSPRRRGRSRYPKEFRRDAAALVIDQRRTVADVARQLGVVEQTLGNWVRQERIDRGMSERGSRARTGPGSASSRGR